MFAVSRSAIADRRYSDRRSPALRRSQIAATAGALRPSRAATGRRRLFDLDLGVVLERSQRLEAPRHDLVPWLETLDDFHVGRSHDPGLDLNELSHAIPHHENPLQLFLLPLSFLRRQRRRVLLSRRQRLSVSLLLAL